MCMMPYSLTPELYAQFLCALFDAWYRDWRTITYVSIRLFEDYIQLLLGGPAGTWFHDREPAVSTWSWRRVAQCIRATSSAWMPINLVRFKTIPCNRCLPAKKCERLSRMAGRYLQNVSNANGYGCAVVAASATEIRQLQRSAVAIATPYKSFSPTRNRACTK